MNKEIVVSVDDNVVNTAILEEGRLMEFHQEETSQKFNVGDIYLGKIKKLAPGMNASFVSIGSEKDAFLHYHDLGPNVRSLLKYIQIVRAGKFKTPNLKNFRNEPQIHKDGKISEVLQPGQKILVQVAKEPISTKGPRVTSEISLPGRYLVLVPFSDKVSISQKIKDKKERDRLMTLVESIKPQGFGVIIRTVAENKKVAELHADLSYLEDIWNRIYNNLKTDKIPMCVFSEMGRSAAILRDRFSEDFVKIYTDDEQLAEELREYIKFIAPGREKIVTLYTKKVPIMENFGVERQIKQSFGKMVNIPGSKGAYLVIEHTEALHVIDVNSGNIKGAKDSQEQNALDVNLKAASEIARQLRLRDMGGIVVVDFIDMRDSKNKKELYEHLRNEMQKDTARHKVLPPSKFGLIQITRQRVRPELAFKTHEDNPNKNGEVEAPIVLLQRIESQLKKISENKKTKKVVLSVHPFVAAYLSKGLPSIRQKWAWKYKLAIKVIPMDSFKYLEVLIEDGKGNKLYHETN